jgi:hypothetical protein
VDTPLVTGNWDAWKGAYPQGPPEGLTWQKAVDDAAAAGFQYVVIAYLMPAERGSLDTFAATPTSSTKPEKPPIKPECSSVTITTLSSSDRKKDRARSTFLSSASTPSW